MKSKRKPEGEIEEQHEAGGVEGEQHERHAAGQTDRLGTRCRPSLARVIAGTGPSLTVALPDSRDPLLSSTISAAP